MSISRRNFLSGILATGMAPAIIQAENAMKIIVPKQDIVIPTGYHNWTNGTELCVVQWYRDGKPIPGATSRTYTLVEEDVNKTLYMGFEVERS